MKLVASTIVALFATVAMANTTATPAAPTTEPAATEAVHETTTPATATHESETASATIKHDCTKLHGKAKAKCEAAAKTKK